MVELEDEDDEGVLGAVLPPLGRSGGSKASACTWRDKGFRRSALAAGSGGGSVEAAAVKPTSLIATLPGGPRGTDDIRCGTWGGLCTAESRGRGGSGNAVYTNTGAEHRGGMH